MSSVAQARAGSIGDALSRSVARRGNSPAIAFGERTWTYAEINTAADRVAGLLHAQGIRKGDRVAAYGRNSDAYFLGWLGCLRSGAIHVPINYALTGDELTYILQQSEARALLFDIALQDNVDAVVKNTSVEIMVPFIAEGGSDVLSAALSHPPIPEVPVIGTEDLAQIMYTSGTTSRPKGAMMSHGAMMFQYASCLHGLDFKEDDRSLSALPLYHTAQLHAFLMPQIISGSFSRILVSPEPAEVLRCMEEEGITSFFAPPTVWVSLLRHPDFDQRDLGKLHKLYYGASIMPEPVLQDIRQRLPQAGLYNVYGQTEIAPVATILSPEEHEERPTSAGRPALFVESRIVDEEMNEVAPGTLGEIVHRSPQLLSGYWGKPAETQEAFHGGWFHSGDLGYRDEAGYFYVVDRIKDVINTGGVLVASREVEEALFTHPSVSEAAVIALPDPKWIEAITAVVVLRSGEQAEESAIIDHCRTLLAPYKLPKRVVFIADLPRNASGKILKRELRAELQE
ncbi:MAG: AMP-binding protein [Novosphingobium sp.]|nr:AMP-binding protein [Novosphingobium sp.]